MAILSGFLSIFVGVLFIWVGAFQIVTHMVPHSVGMMIAEKHGAWMRENVFKLPPIKEAANGK